MSTLGSPVPTTVMAWAAVVAARATVAPTAVRIFRFMYRLLLSFLQHQAPLDAASIGTLLRDLQNQFPCLRGRSPDPSDPTARGAHAQDLHGPAVHPPRRLDSRTCEVLKLARLTVQIQDGAGAGNAAVCL